MAWRAVEDVIEKSRQKSEMLRDVGDAILRAEKLEEELKKAKQQASNLQIRLDWTGTLWSTATKSRC